MPVSRFGCNECFVQILESGAKFALFCTDWAWLFFSTVVACMNFSVWRSMIITVFKTTHPSPSKVKWFASYGLLQSFNWIYSFAEFWYNIMQPRSTIESAIYVLNWLLTNIFRLFHRKYTEAKRCAKNATLVLCKDTPQLRDEVNFIYDRFNPFCVNLSDPPVSKRLPRKSGPRRLTKPALFLL